MNNRVTPYEAGWLTMLVDRGVCTEEQARDAMRRVAQAAIDELNERRAAEKWLKKSRRKKRKDQ
jgi:hypothetical protein